LRHGVEFNTKHALKVTHVTEQWASTYRKSTL